MKNAIISGKLTTEKLERISQQKNYFYNVSAKNCPKFMDDFIVSTAEVRNFERFKTVEAFNVRLLQNIGTFYKGE